MSDITEQLQLASTTPEDAIKNIDNGRLFNMGADQYKEHKPYLQSEADLLKLNTKVTRGVAEYGSQSSQHASLIKDDSFKLSQAENLFTEAKEKFDGTGIQKKIDQLKLKQTSTPDTFTEDDAVNLFMMEDDLKSRNSFKLDKAGKNDEIVNKYFEKQKETSFLEAGLRSYRGAFLNQLGNVAKLPALAYDLYYYPANLLRAFRGEPEIKTPENLRNNPAVQIYTSLAKQFNSQVPELNKDMTDSIAKGDFGEAGRIGALKFINNFPNQAGIIASTMIAGPGAGMGFAALSEGVESNFENQEKGFTPSQSLPNAAAKATISAAFERFGTIGLIKNWETALTSSFGKDAAGKVIFNTLKAIGLSSGVEGLEEGGTSVVQDLTDYVSGINPNALEGIGGRAIESFAVGGISGGLLTGPSAALKAGSNILLYGEMQDNKRRAVDLLNFDSNVSNAMEMVKQAKMADLSSAETALFLEKIFDKIKFKSVYVAKETMQKFANTPEKALAIRNIINPTGEAAAALNAPIAIPAHEFFALTMQFPELQQDYQLTPEGASVKQATEFLQSVNEANQNKQDVLSKLQAPEQTPEDVQMINEALNPEQPNESDILNEDSYLDTTRMEAALRKILPETEVKSIVEAQTKAKQSVVDNINETAQFEMDQVVDVGVQEALEVEKEAQLKQLESSPNLDIVDKFQGYIEIGGDSELRHKKKGYSPVAIDPSTVPAEYQAFLENEQLLKHKVFVEGGISLNDSATLLGVSSGIELLRILSKTPTRAEVVEARVAAARLDIENETKAQVGLNEVGISNALNARLANAVETMKIMKDKFWSATKKGFKGIALTPSPKKLMSDAKAAILKTKVGDLNINQFKVGERRSERIAWDAVAANNVEKAYVNQEAVAKNIALGAQTQLAIGKVNRVVKLARKFNKASVIQELKDAGPLYLEAAQEILEVFNLTSRKSNKAERDSFKRWSEKVAKEGQPIYVIPERLQDQRESLSDMTVEQVLAAGNALESILHQARYKNKLFKKHESIKGLQTVERIATLVEENAQKAFDQNNGRIEVRQDMSWLEKKAEGLLGMKVYLERMQHILVKLDNDKEVGFFNDLFWRPLVEASAAKKQLLEETRIQIDKIIENFGKKEFDNMSNEIVEVPEFKGMNGFPTGKFTKSQLFAMELNFGNEGNLAELEKYGGFDADGKPLIGRDVIRKVLDRELSEKHTLLAQDFWNVFASFQPKMSELQKRTEGTDATWVEPKPFEARGKQVPGGYYPIFRLSDKAKIAAKKAQGVTEMKTLENFKISYYGNAMTEQGHLESRTGNDDFLNLELSAMPYAISQVIHDLTHREVIADGVKLLAEKRIRDAIVSVIGKDGYANILDTYVNIAQEAENDSYGDNPFLNFVNRITNGVQIVAIGGKINSILIQPSSVLVALDRMGKAQSLPYFYKNVTMILNNPSLLGAVYSFAEELNPAIISFTEDVSKNSASGLLAQMPVEGNAIITPIKAASETVTAAAFKGLSEVDKLNKVLVTITAYQMAIEGKVKGLEHLKGDHKESAKYASNMTELTQTHNDIRNLPPVLRNKYLRPFVLFYNDLNNLLNNSIGAGRRSRKEFSKGNAWAGTAIAGSFTLTLIMLQMFQGAIRGEKFPGDDENNEDPLFLQWGKYLLRQPLEALAGTLPLARDANFALGKTWEKRKNVQLPLESGLSEIATAMSAIPALMDYLMMVEDGKKITRQQEKALWLSAGIGLKAPTGFIYDLFVKRKSDREASQKSMLDRLSELTQKTIQNPEVTLQFKEDLKKFEARINPKKLEISEQTYSVLKQVISESNSTAYNENTGAAGIYQFTEEVWNNLMKDAPELGLTENGRVSQKTEQQQKAFEYTAKQTGTFLRAAGIEVTPENIYAGHLFGGLKAVQVLSAKNDTKLNTLVDVKTLKEYDINENVTVAEFKDWLLFRIVEAEERLTNDKNK